MDSWHSYPKVYNLGHGAIREILQGPIIIEEKIDGSQFSWGRFDGELKCRSRGAVLNVIAPEKMFEKAVKVAESLDLHNGWTYRAEYLMRPKHNTLAYSRVPKNHLVIFDINTDNEVYLTYEEKAEEAERIGLEIVPLLYYGEVNDMQMFRSLLGSISFLGGAKIEGVVVKNYQRFCNDGKVMLGKFVSEEFKEVHNKDWKERNPNRADILFTLVESYRTPARWMKAVQHLREREELEDSPRDIGKLIKECKEDTEEECKEEIMAALFKWAWPNISRGVVAGIAEWYKDQLLKKQFEDK